MSMLSVCTSKFAGITLWAVIITTLPDLFCLFVSLPNCEELVNLAKCGERSEWDRRSAESQQSVNNSVCARISL